MTASQLDFYFPFIVFFYGVLLIFVIDLPVYQRVRQSLAPSRLAANPWGTPAGQRFLFFMTVFSGLWSLQNLIFS